MKIISIKKEKIMVVFYVLILFTGIISSFYHKSVSVSTMPMSKKVILIDAGHGGFDPGKVSENVLEKDINLEIAKKLQSYFEQGGSVVLMTRINDQALSNTKNMDMKSRKELANLSKADLIISIHQNSFPQENVKGAQVFYFGDSTNSKTLADKIQDEIKNFADPQNQRAAKENDSYYILKKTKIPAVIVECGFLTNYEERQELLKEEYQEKIAWSIYKGVLEYFEAGNNPTMAYMK